MPGLSAQACLRQGTYLVNQVAVSLRQESWAVSTAIAQAAQESKHLPDFAVTSIPICCPRVEEKAEPDDQSIADPHAGEGLLIDPGRVTT